MRLGFEWLMQDMPFVWQWVGLFATIAGALFSLWAVISAKGAKRQALEAKDAAVRLGQVLLASDLIQEMEELRTMAGGGDFTAITTKASRLRGRIARFKVQVTRLGNDNAGSDLDVARQQIESVMKTAASKAKPETRSNRILLAITEADEALNRAFATHHADAIEDRP